MPQQLPPGFQLEGGSPAPRRAPGVIQGPPAVPTPMQQQSLENEGVRIGIAQQGEQRAQSQFEQGGVSEKQAKFLLSRVGGGIDDINFIAENMVGGKGAPSLKDAVLYNAFGPNGIATRGLTSEGRKAIEDVQLDMLDALLTLGTGAAYNAEQLQAERAAYFPQFNDSDAAVTLKRRRLERLFNDAVSSAGPLAADLEKYRGQFLGAALPEGDGARKPTARDEMPAGARLRIEGGNDDPFDRNRYLQERFGIDPGVETRFTGMVNANLGNPNVTPEMVAGFYRSAGMVPPEQAELERLANDMKSGKFGPATGFDLDAARQDYIAGLDTIIERAGFNPEGQAETLANATRQGAALEGFDEIVGVTNAIAEGLQFNNPIEGYRTGRDVTRRMIQRGDEANPMTGIAGRVIGSIATGGVGASGRVATAGQAARVGAVEAGITGFNAGQGGVNSVGNALVSAPLGAGVGAGIQAGGNALLRRFNNPARAEAAANAAEVTAAAERRGVPVRQYDVDPQAAGRRADLMQNDRTRGTIQAADAQDRAAMETAITRDLGGETTDFSAGSIIGEGAVRGRQQIRQRAGRLYTRAQNLARGTNATPTRALEVIDQNLAELRAAGPNQNADQIRYLEGVRADLAREGGLSIDVLRSQRTGMRDSLKASNLDKTDAERRVTMVLDAAAEDINRALSRNPEALTAFREADQLWRQQAQFKKQILDKIVGPNAESPFSPEQTSRAVQNFIGKDFKRARMLWTELNPEERSEVASLVASNLGRNNRGEFSIDLFLTHTGAGRGRKIDEKAARLIFGEDGLKAINDLRVLAQAKSAGQSASNRSNAGGVVQKSARGLRTAMLTMLGFSEAGVTGGVVAPAAANFISNLGDQRAARLLTNPDVTRWMRQTPESSDPRVINRHFQKLRSIASRTPGMVADVSALERAFVAAVNDNGASRLAAEEQQPKEPQ